MLTQEIFGRLAAKVWPADQSQHEDTRKLLERLDKVCNPPARPRQ